MINPETIDALLARGHAAEPAGSLLNHYIERQSGRVSRYRRYSVYLPAGYSPAREYPLLMVLHGCHQDHMAIREITGFDAIADRAGVIIVYPFVTTYSGLRTQNCWGWWLTAQRQRGRGEVSDLRRIAQDVSKRYSVDANRRHICGLSAGGAMSVVSLAAYSDFWASGASVAGLPYGESSRAVRVNPHLPVRYKNLRTLTRMLSRELITSAPPLLVVQCSQDKVVSAKLGENLRDSWLSVSNSDETPAAIHAHSTHGAKWRFEQFHALGVLQVGYLFIDDLEHGWPGGRPGEFSFPYAPNCSELIWAYFEQCASDRESQYKNDFQADG